MYDNFNTALSKSLQTEKLVIDFMSTQGWVFMGNNSDFRYDLRFWIPDIGIRLIELKHDYITHKTNNLAIEYSSRGKESGINTTKSDYYMFFLDKLNELWMITTKNLRSLIAVNLFKKINGGDEGSNTLFYLIPKDEFKENFIIWKVRGI